MTEQRALAWQRFTGTFASASSIPASSCSVIGVAPDACPCCDERYVVIAAVHAAGFEVSVSLTPEVAHPDAGGDRDAWDRLSDAYRRARKARR